MPKLSYGNCTRDAHSCSSIGDKYFAGKANMLTAKPIAAHQCCGYPCYFVQCVTLYQWLLLLTWIVGRHAKTVGQHQKDACNIWLPAPCIHKQTYTYTHKHMHACTCTHTHAHTHTHTHTHTQCACMHAHTHTHTHTHTHLKLKWWWWWWGGGEGGGW